MLGIDQRRKIKFLISFYFEPYIILKLFIFDKSITYSEDHRNIFKSFVSVIFNKPKRTIIFFEQ